MGESAANMDRHGGIETLQGQVLDAPARGRAASVVDQNVDTAVGVGSLLDGALHIRRPGHVGLNEGRAGGGRHLGPEMGAPAAEHHGGALLDETLDMRLPIPLVPPVTTAILPSSLMMFPWQFHHRP